MTLLLRDKLVSKEVDWLAWEDPFLFGRGAAQFKLERENSLLEAQKRLAYIIILPITFIIRLFNPKVGIYEINNNGCWYDLGFFLRVSGSVGGGTRTVYVYQ
ncbi:MAG TPA: hypothetical protein PKZ84_04635 [Anaerolineae bacterium]|nr:hypothetical protein [Anaerolineae bacterium]HQI83855.1 hypothetical protein [Anaerolineae bacterium]